MRREPTLVDKELAERIESACEMASLRLSKIENTTENCGVTPALALAIELYPDK